jgi:hypothetical protein
VTALLGHALRPDPFGRDTCDEKTEEDGRVRTCCRKRAEHDDPSAPAANSRGALPLGAA